MQQLNAPMQQLNASQQEQTIDQESTPHRPLYMTSPQHQQQRQLQYATPQSQQKYPKLFGELSSMGRDMMRRPVGTPECNMLLGSSVGSPNTP
jgi:hypothetical protein